LKIKELLAACFLIFGALLVWPLLRIPNRPLLVGGVPLLVLYLFVVWVAIVVVLAWASRRAAAEDGP
jgi:hypothetical protein